MTQRWFQRVEGEAEPEPVSTTEAQLANDLAVLRDQWNARQTTVAEAMRTLEPAHWMFYDADHQPPEETDWRVFATALDEMICRALRALRRVPL